jgi:hypothetical protein
VMDMLSVLPQFAAGMKQARGMSRRWPLSCLRCRVERFWSRPRSAARNERRRDLFAALVWTHASAETAFYAAPAPSEC